MCDQIMKNKRKSLDIATKLEIIEKYDNCNYNKAMLVKEYDLALSTVNTILKNREKIVSAWKKNEIYSSNKKIRGGEHSELEDKLYHWLISYVKCDKIIENSTLRAKAKEFAITMGISNFSCSYGWVAKFKKRYRQRLQNQMAAKKGCTSSHCSDVDAKQASFSLENTQVKIECEIDDETMTVVKAEPPDSFDTDQESTRLSTAAKKSNEIEFLSLNSSLDQNNSFKNETKIDDDLVAFGQSITKQLQAIPDQYSRSVAKYKIQQVLFEAETGQYRIV